MARTNMEIIQITQKRSLINSPERQKRTMKALGLRRINHTIQLVATPQIRGMVRKVNHLVTINKPSKA